MSDVYRDFLRILDLMTSPILSGDGFTWMIRSIDMLPDGPCAMFHYDWHKTKPGMVPTSSHDSFTCMSLRTEFGRFVLRDETCTMGPTTRDASQALRNRYQRALKAIKV